MRPSISLAIIMRDVEKTLDKCLNTFSKVSDEIIIVDTGSVDKSVEIAKKYTDKIYHFEWIDDFAAARNFSFEKCTKNWIFWIDADDFILDEDIKKINELDFTGKDVIIIKYAYCRDQYGNIESFVPRERIVRRAINPKWVGRIHEHIPLTGKSIHVSDIVTFHDKQGGTSERNLRILENIVKNGEEDARYTHYLGREYYDFGRYDDAIKHLKKYLEYPGIYWEDVYQVHYKLALCYFEKREEHSFLYHVYESLKVQDQWAEPFYILGLWYMNKGEQHRAIQWYEMCLKVKRPDNLLTAYQPRYYTWLPNLNLCVCYSNVNEYQKAFECNQQVLKYRPEDDKALHNDKFLRGILKMDPQSSKKDGTGVRLNLGCGNKALPGYVNVDIFDAPHINEKFDLYDVPYNDNTIEAIYSEHSLEHVPAVRAYQAIKEWYRVLRPGGELLLRIPNFERCCQEYINASDDQSRQWYKYTIYGLQTHQFNNQPDEAEIHRYGFSPNEIKGLLEKEGFVIDYCETYDGLGTPSIGIRALKPLSSKKIGWFGASFSELADYVRAEGYFSTQVYDYEDMMCCDVIVIGPPYFFFDELKDSDKEIVSYIREYREDLTDIIIGSDKIVVDNDIMKEEFKQLNMNIFSISE